MSGSSGARATAASYSAIASAYFVSWARATPVLALEGLRARAEIVAAGGGDEEGGEWEEQE